MNGINGVHPSYATRHEVDNLRSSHAALRKQVKDNHRNNREWWMSLTARFNRRLDSHGTMIAILFSTNLGTVVALLLHVIGII